MGDCEIILVSNNGRRIERLNKPHRATGKSERRRIEAAGGFVVKGRAMGVLEPSRTLGDVDVKRMCPGAISAEPEVGIVDLKDILSHDEAGASLEATVGGGLGGTVRQDMFAIMATDGVFDVMDHYDAVTCVRNSLMSKKREKVAAEILCKKAADMGSKDDITAIVVRFR